MPPSPSRDSSLRFQIEAPAPAAAMAEEDDVKEEETDDEEEESAAALEIAALHDRLVAATAELVQERQRVASLQRTVEVRGAHRTALS